MKYDAIIIGFGKAGKTLASYLGSKNKKVALIEKDKNMYGGTCINVGCIPSKSLVNSANSFLDKSATFSQKAMKFKESIEEKEKLTSLLRNKNYAKLASNPYISIINGEASFIEDKKILVKKEDEELILESDFIYINTGSISILPKIKGINNDKVVTSTGIMNLKELPKRLTIIGGGYIGLEFASMFNKFGSNVTILDFGSSFIPREDDDIANEIKKDFIDDGIKIILNANIIEILDDGSVVYKIGDEEFKIESDIILAATGRKPNIDSLNLKNTSIELTERGAIKTNELLETSVKNTFALGDVNGGLQFTYVSLDDFRIIKDYLENVKNPRTLNNRINVPYSVFISPSLSRVGLSEKEAIKQGYEIKVFKIPASSIPKSQVLKSTKGLLKAVVDIKTDLILGASLYCEESYEIINIIKLAMDANLKYTVLKNNIYTHPTMSEALNDLFN